MYKIRICYSKCKEAMYLTPVDIAKIFERSLNRADISVIYSIGFTPKAEMVFALPLSIGMESIGELCDIFLEEYIEGPTFIKLMNSSLPNGIAVLSVEYIEGDEKDLLSLIKVSEYEINLEYTDPMFLSLTHVELESAKRVLKEKFNEYISQDEILVMKKTKYRMERIDIKKLILDVDLNNEYKILVKVVSNSQEELNPDLIMQGFEEYIDRTLSYNVKRIKMNI